MISIGAPSVTSRPAPGGTAGDPLAAVRPWPSLNQYPPPSKFCDARSIQPYSALAGPAWAVAASETGTVISTSAATTALASLENMVFLLFASAARVHPRRLHALVVRPEIAVGSGGSKRMGGRQEDGIG